MRGPFVLLVALVGLFGFGRSVDAAKQDQVIAGFRLTDSRGTEVSLSEFADQKAVVVVFVGTDCPLVKLYAPRLQEIAGQFAGRDVTFLAINANAQDSLLKINEFTKRYALGFPILKDPDQKVADAFGARRTPEVFVLDAARTVRYRGRIDDQYGVGYQKPEAARHDLVEAIDAVIAGREVSVAQTEAPGCFIGRTNREVTSTEVTYAEHIASIFQNRCQECHRESEIGPFELEDYEDAVAWSETIQEVVDQGRMPPWFADPKYGEFLHNPTLSETEKDLIRKWVSAGCPAGDLASMPPAPKFVDGWLMDTTPDVVFQMSDKPYHVPAEGVLDYVYYEIDPKWDEDRWIWGSEARPGAREVVHHILIFVKKPGKFYPPGLPGELISAYAPGMKPTVAVDETHGLLIPKGSKFIMQMHYTSNGRAQDDLSYFGIKFHPNPDKIEWEALPGMAINLFFAIPPHADNHRVPGLFVMPEDALLLGVNPHMHMRGKSFVYEAIYPDGKREIIMNCPKFDFNWQLGYQFAEPLFLPKGTKIACAGYYDNSENNPNNPDPTKRVTFGEQTWHEMMIGWFYYAVRRSDEVAVRTNEATTAFNTLANIRKTVRKRTSSDK